MYLDNPSVPFIDGVSSWMLIDLVNWTHHLRIALPLAVQSQPDFNKVTSYTIRSTTFISILSLLLSLWLYH